MGDGRILERTAVFIDTLSAACRLPVQGNRTETVDIYTKNQKCNLNLTPAGGASIKSFFIKYTKI